MDAPVAVSAKLAPSVNQNVAPWPGAAEKSARLFQPASELGTAHDSEAGRFLSR